MNMSTAVARDMGLSSTPAQMPPPSLTPAPQEHSGLGAVLNRGSLPRTGITEESVVQVTRTPTNTLNTGSGRLLQSRPVAMSGGTGKMLPALNKNIMFHKFICSVPLATPAAYVQLVLRHSDYDSLAGWSRVAGLG